MPRTTTLTYPQLRGLNKINRYSARETYSLSTIHGIINSSSVLHISLPPPGGDSPFPICLPMVGVAASYEHPSAGLGEPLDVYVHGYVSARMMNMARKGGETDQEDGGEGEGDAGSGEGTSGSGGSGGEQKKKEEGLPVTVSATKVDGLVLSLTPFCKKQVVVLMGSAKPDNGTLVRLLPLSYTHDINYRSATLHGHATLVTHPAEKIWAMTQITNSVLPNRWPHTRVPPTSAELSSTAILKINIVSGSGKIRVGGPRDEDKDLRMCDDTLVSVEEGGSGSAGVFEAGIGFGIADGKLWRDKVWTGVVPVWETLGTPVWGGSGRGGEEAGGGKVDVPEHVRVFVEETRRANEEYALNAIKDRSQD